MTSRIPFDHRSYSSWLSWAALSLGCVSGCASWDQMAQHIAHPWQSSGDMIARSNERLVDAWDGETKRSAKPQSSPASQLANRANPTTPKSNPKVVPASMPSPAPSKPLTPAPADVELLPAPPVSQASATVATTEAPANTAWCRIRVRNIGSQTATQVAVSVSSPANAPLVSKEGTSVSAPTLGKMEFAPVAEVKANEEVILLVGVATADERANRLRVQIRDAQGGTNQELQARWKIAIEAIE